MPRHHCTSEHHTWSVHSTGDRLSTATLRHGHACHCGHYVIAHIECEQGCRHKRVITKARFDKLMEDK